MKSGQYLELQWNKYSVLMRVPKDLQNVFGTTAFKKTLKTSDFLEAEILKLPYIIKWKQRIKAARKGGADLEAALERKVSEAEEMREHFTSSEQDYSEITERFFVAKDNTDLLNENEKDNLRAIAMAGGKLTPTKRYVIDWLDQHNYQPDVRDETERFLLTNFCVRFPTFEQIKVPDLKIWLEELKNGTTELNKNRQWTIATIGKNFSRVRLYWTWCFEKYTNAPNLALQPGVMPTRPKTKAHQEATSNASFKPFSKAEALLLISAARKVTEENSEQKSQNLEDAIRIGLYTGMRIGEIANMKTDDVGKDRFTVVDSKTYNGLRDIPIHPDIQQLVERLMQTSKDGYLISGESTDNKYNKRSPGLSKRFGRLKKKLGFENKRHAFHSLRATLAARFESAGVLENFAARIIGHQVETMTYGLYSGKIDWDKAVEAMAKVSYEE